MRRSIGYFFSSMLLPFSAQATEAVPDNLINLEVQQTTIDTIARVLPERSQINGAFLDSQYDPNFHFLQDANAAVTFISEGAGYRNSLGYISYDQGTFDNLGFSDLDINGSGNITPDEVGGLSGVNNIGIVFGNASGSGGFAGSGGTLNTGDTTVLGGGTFNLVDGAMEMNGGTTFQQGETLSFFLMANAWDGRQVRGWDTGHDQATYWTLDGLNPENRSASLVDYNRHVAVLDIESQPEIILGFEDLLRPFGDNDFNDAVFTITTNPVESVDVARFQSVSPAPLPPSSGVLALVMLGGAVFFGRRARQDRS